MVSIGASWNAARSSRTVSGIARPSVLLALVSLLARALPVWPRVRTATLTLTGFAFLDYAAWRRGVIAGCVSIGVSLLILEALSAPRERERR